MPQRYMKGAFDSTRTRSGLRPLPGCASAEVARAKVFSLGLHKSRGGSPRCDATPHRSRPSMVTARPAERVRSVRLGVHQDWLSQGMFFGLPEKRQRDGASRRNEEFRVSDIRVSTISCRRTFTSLDQHKLAAEGSSAPLESAHPMESDRVPGPRVRGGTSDPGPFLDLKQRGTPLGCWYMAMREDLPLPLKPVASRGRRSAAERPHRSTDSLRGLTAAFAYHSRGVFPIKTGGLTHAHDRVIWRGNFP